MAIVDKLIALLMTSLLNKAITYLKLLISSKYITLIAIFNWLLKLRLTVKYL